MVVAGGRLSAFRFLFCLSLAACCAFVVVFTDNLIRKSQFVDSFFYCRDIKFLFFLVVPLWPSAAVFFPITPSSGLVKAGEAEAMITMIHLS